MGPDNFVTDISNKIIAQLSDTDRNNIRCCCKKLKSLCKRTNHSIYMHTPLNLSGRNLITALLYATHYQNKAAIENLLQHGADPNTHIHLRILPLSIAKYQKNERTMQLLKKYHAKDYTVMCPLYSLAAFMGDLPLLKAYIRNEKTLTPFEALYPSNPFLHTAIFNGHTHIIKYVLQTQSLRYLKDVRYHDMTTLYFAALNDRAAIIELLLKESPFMINDICDPHGFTALHIATVRKHYNVAQLLIAHPNININVQDKNLQAPLHIAVYNEDIDLIQLLLAQSTINLNIKNKNKQTPLDIAKILQNNIIQELLSKRDAKTYFYLSKIAPWEQNKNT